MNEAIANAVRDGKMTETEALAAIEDAIRRELRHGVVAELEAEMAVHGIQAAFFDAERWRAQAVVRSLGDDLVGW